MESKAWYAEQTAAVQAERDRLRGTERTLNGLRVGLFFGGILLLVLGWAADASAPAGAELLWWGGWLALAGFLAVVTIHEGRREQIERLRNRRNVLRRLAARLDRNWDRLPVWAPPPGVAFKGALEGGGVADDLDLFGRGSLMQLVSMAYTGPGLRALAEWLTQAALPEQGSARATAARALAADRAGRLRFYELARQSAASAAEPDAFTAWAAGPRWLARRHWLVVWAWIAPVLTLLGFVLGGWLLPGLLSREYEWFDLATAFLTAAVPLVINLLLTVWMSGPVHAIFARAVSRRGDIEGYAEMFAAAGSLPESPEMIATLREKLVGGRSGSATEGMQRLGRLANLVSARRGGAGYLLFTILQILVLWDVHLLSRLERWQAQYGTAAEEWFAALGQLEALESLAALHDDYPEWAVAEWTPSGPEARLTAVGLAHPLLPDGVRVANDVRIGPAGTLLLVTGSNMSGKSTLLRSVGLNVVLAGAGGPVCATSMQLPPVELTTSIRVRDSVREGVSFYMAELHRLRDCVEHARRLQHQSDRCVLYLLDEILQGTNSRERAIAVVRVLRHLIGSGAIGAVSTHDLELAEDPQLEHLAHVVHFRETIERDAQGAETMRFDYRMREGVTPTTNALRLLEWVGLGDASPEP
ncbi:MutS family DNA mismatch repair protein [Candidatus Laterigemmans baculatus]|uniref:MutS family DNA mismatch repair protein n=1 Tax=Candidatus Laterigemmans baculatus TaxID=2770505 RepID=UPI0013DD7733|nr:MutS family DNA mismatch repair protein [Candidatus Laterigemmans baculatus]